MTDTITDRINFLRMKVLEGGDLSREEAKEALNLMREQRKAILNKQTAKEASKAPVNLNDLFT